jgi:hypothetical protein
LRKGSRRERESEWMGKEKGEEKRTEGEEKERQARRQRGMEKRDTVEKKR